MKEKRLKLITIGMHVAAVLGKKFSEKLKGSLPEDAFIIAKHEDFRTGSINVVVYHDGWEVINPDKSLPKMNIDILLKEEKPTIQLIK